MENILQIADLTKRYPDFYLDHLTLNVPSGSIVGLIGENGAGKTTTMNLILNAVTKDSGDILVSGKIIFPMKRGQTADRRCAGRM